MTANWADVTPAKFLEHVKEGMSYSAIGDLYGVTRNVISGKVLRWKQRALLPEVIFIGYAKRKSATERTQKRYKAQSKKEKSSTHRGGRHVSPKLDSFVALTTVPEKLVTSPRVPVPPPDPYIKGTVPVPIMKLTSTQCAVVVGVDEERMPTYCGCQVANEKFRMCEFHASYMLQLPTRKDRVSVPRRG